jgi:hypothetical protein
VILNRIFFVSKFERNGAIMKNKSVQTLFTLALSVTAVVAGAQTVINIPIPASSLDSGSRAVSVIVPAAALPSDLCTSSNGNCYSFSSPQPPSEGSNGRLFLLKNQTYKVGSASFAVSGIKNVGPIYSFNVQISVDPASQCHSGSCNSTYTTSPSYSVSVDLNDSRAFTADPLKTPMFTTDYLATTYRGAKYAKYEFVQDGTFIYDMTDPVVTSLGSNAQSCATIYQFNTYPYLQVIAGGTPSNVGPWYASESTASGCAGGGQ